MSRGLMHTAVVLGLMSSIGPFAIDMYLPVLPDIGRSLGADVAEIQMTLTSYFIAFGISQLFYGPLADQIGRKKPLYIGLGIFILASIGCALSSSIEWLAAFRFMQGLGGAAVMVVPRAIVRDMYSGTEATRLMALIMLVISVSPMLAPLTGSSLVAFVDWRAIFVVLAGAAAVSLLLAAFALPETMHPEYRIPINVPNMLRGARVLFRDPVFMGLTLIGGAGMASFFVFIASAAFVYSEQYGLSPMQFSLAFAVNAIGFFSATQMAAPLGERIGMTRLVSRAVTGFALSTLVLTVLVMAGIDSIYVIIGGLFAANSCLGLVIPTSMVMALEDHPDNAGLASSLGGTMQMLAGGGMIMAAGPFFDGTSLPMVAAIFLCALSALILTRFVLYLRPDLVSEEG